jgi:hypothetical protein
MRNGAEVRQRIVAGELLGTMPRFGFSEEYVHINYWVSLSPPPRPRLIIKPQPAVQITRYDLTRLPRMPLHTEYRRITARNLMIHLTRLPVPEAQETSAVARADELPVRTNRHVRRVPSNIVAPVTLLPVLAETVGRGVDGDLVVGRLEGDVFA